MPFLRKNAKQLIRNGRRIYGGIYDLPSGLQIYIAYRKQAEMFRSGEKTLSEAIQKDTACWAVDNDTLITLRMRGVYLVGIQVKETDDLYVATLADFNNAKMLNYEGKGGALQRYLPLNRFMIQLGSAQKPSHPKRSN